MSENKIMLRRIRDKIYWLKDKKLVLVTSVKTKASDSNKIIEFDYLTGVTKHTYSVPADTHVFLHEGKN